MSRCFPFPPPGYERKARTDDTDLLKKEKHRERKNKKEKKDKEKRDGKEKREKDRSDGKHRDKKDKKEKHREKKKDNGTDRDKDKDKSCTSEEKKTTSQSQSYCNGEKLNHKELELEKEKRSTSKETKQGHSREKAEKPTRNSLLSEGTGDYKFVQELDRRLRDEEKGSGCQLVDRLPGSEQKNDERLDSVAVKDTGILAEEKEGQKEKKVDNRKINGQQIRGDTRSSGSAVVQNLAGMVQNRVEGMPRPFEKKLERRMEEKDKSKEREGDVKPGDKRKSKDREKKSHGKDKDRDKDNKKEEKVKEKSDLKNKDPDIVKDRSKSDLLGTQIKTSCVSERNTATEGIQKKRKDFEANGFLHETDVRPNKLPRAPPHPITENGRKLEPCQTPTQSTSDKHGPQNHLKVESKEHKVNGLIEAQSLTISSKKSSSAINQADKIAEVSIKPPHPDSKYWSQVLIVPKMEEWSDYDEQEWLFSSKGHSSEKPDVGSARFTETPRVWAEALQIESADVCALPYVIPY